MPYVVQWGQPKALSGGSQAKLTLRSNENNATDWHSLRKMF